MRDTWQTLPAELLIQQLLEFVAARPRCYAEVIEAWRTSCPRLPVWEVAVERDLVRIDHQPGRPMADCAVVLTAGGRQALATVPTLAVTATGAVESTSAVVPTR